MRALIKYISLLLFSGLIIPFCCFTFYVNPASITKANPLKSSLNSPDNNPTLSQTIIMGITKNIFPVLKSLNYL
jgi:hypothetical protein